MKALCIVILALLLPIAGAGAEPISPGAYLAAGELLDTDLPRYGLNLGGSGTWGAEHLRANLLGNPGFEPVLDRTLIIIKEANANHMVDDTPWLARGDGFWNGASFEVRSGRQAGFSGKVTDSYKRNADGLAEFTTDSDVSKLRPGDVVSITRTKGAEVAPQWWIGRGHLVNTNEVRPGSSGQQAVRLLASSNTPAELLHYFDNITERAGKLLLVNGRWHLGFWARSIKSGGRLHLYFGRQGSRPFLETDVKPETEWKRYQLDFNATDKGPLGVLTLSITAANGEVVLDDAYLGESDPGAGGFRQAVVETLKTLRPGYLRDWQGQLGDTFNNRIANEAVHQPVRYRPGENEIQFHYGLPDFFALCHAVGARPWVVSPTTLSETEWKSLGAYLRQAADKYQFDEILVEFGNENWNQVFRPGGIPDVTMHAAVADRSFRLLKQAADYDKRIITIANAQYVNPESPQQLGNLSQEADRIAVAPYLLNRLDAGSDTRAHHAAFEETGNLIQQESATTSKQHKQLSVYEVNFHTTWGSASKEQRNAVVTGAASGAALARRLMQATLVGVREQNVYLLSGFDSYLSDSNDLVHLWGITRDLRVSNHFRPTGLALSMLNSLAGGKTYGTQCTGVGCNDLTALMFGNGRRMAIVSARNEEMKVKVQLNCGNGLVSLQLLDGSRPELNNEITGQVNVQTKDVMCQTGTAQFNLPGQSLAVIGAH